MPVSVIFIREAPHTPCCLAHSPLCHLAAIRSVFTFISTLFPHGRGCILLPSLSLQHSWKADRASHQPSGIFLALRHISSGQYNSSSYPGGKAAWTACNSNIKTGSFISIRANPSTEILTSLDAILHQSFLASSAHRTRVLLIEPCLHTVPMICMPALQN